MGLAFFVRHRGPLGPSDRRGSRLLAGVLAPCVASVVAASPAAASAPPAAEAAHPSSKAVPDKPTTVKSLTVVAAPLPYRLQPGAVVGDITPELQLDPSDIQSYGVSSITELLNELAPQTRSDRGRTQQGPVVLLNGRRISSLNEIQNIPTEAILRIDILPEEVALKYGYTADQRVINFVLKPRFRAVTGEVVGGETTGGGDANAQAEVDRFKVDRDTRLNLDLKYQSSAGLTDAQRGLQGASGGAPFALGGNVVSPTPGAEIDPAFSALVGEPVTVAGVPAGLAVPPTLSDFAPGAGKPNVTDTAADYSLAPATQSLTANAVVARPIFAGVNATLNVTLAGTTSRSLQGLPGVSLLVPAGDPFSPFGSPVVVDRYVAGQSPLQQTIDGWTGHVGTTFNRDVGSWRLSLTGAYNHADTMTTTGTGLDPSGLQALLDQNSATFDPFAPLPGARLPLSPLNTARLTTDGGNVQVLANGPLIRLPAGAVFVSAKIGDAEAFADSSSRNIGVSRAQTLARNDASALLNIDVPLTSRTNHVLAALEDLYFNVNSAVDELSDFGVLPTLGLGVNWTPIPGYTLIVSETHDHQAPTIQQLDAPVIETPGTRIFDYQTGQTVAVTQVSGGNRALKADDRTVFKVGLTVKPIQTQDLTLTANYIDSRIANAISTFPSASPAIEAAFPGRFVQGADGVLEEEDDRPVNFAEQDRQELRWGINYSRPVGKQPPPRDFGRRGYRRRAQGPGGYQRGSEGLAPSGPGGLAPGDDNAEGGLETPGASPPGDVPGGLSARGPGRGYGGGGYGGGYSRRALGAAAARRPAGGSRSRSITRSTSRISTW